MILSGLSGFLLGLLLLIGLDSNTNGGIAEYYFFIIPPSLILFVAAIYFEDAAVIGSFAWLGAAKFVRGITYITGGFPDMANIY